MVAVGGAIIFILLCLAVRYLWKISQQTKPAKPEKWRLEDHLVKDWKKEEEERQAEERKKRAERREFLREKKEKEAKRKAITGPKGRADNTAANRKPHIKQK